MSMSKSNPNQSKTAETPAAGTTTSTSTSTTTTTDKGPDVKGLREELKKRGIGFGQFAAGEENFRKRTLKDEYQELKTKYGWKYDQPIEETETPPA